VSYDKKLAAKRLDPRKRDPAIDEYLAGVSPTSGALLRKLRKTIHALVPAVDECISYRLPAFRFEGRIIAGFSATSTGCSYYPFSGTTGVALILITPPRGCAFAQATA
jgi:uncharacterized protein YdhG (YjbR/CyaY superfamily)